MIVKCVNSSINELPKYSTPDSSGVDLKADFKYGVNKDFLFNSEFTDYLVINPGGRALIPTNIFTEIPSGYEVQIRSRSGLALKQGVFVANGIGTIDADFRNSWGVILMNQGDKPFIIQQGDRIAQAVLVKVEKIEWEEVLSLNDTKRGLGGYGSTGKN